MKNFWQSLAVAFALYSKIPMPQVLWRKENMRYALCFLPLVGAVIGAVEALWLEAAKAWALPVNLAAAGAVFWPLILSGGIHLDGFCDTIDALFSHREPQRKGEILQDPHIGAFALIYCGAYLLLLFGLWSAVLVYEASLWLVASSFVLARAYGASRIVKVALAKPEGLAATFAQEAEKKRVYKVLMTVLGLTLLMAWWLDWRSALVLAMVMIVFHCYFERMVRREFAGISGDLAGYAVTMVELLILAAIVLVEVIRCV